MKFIQSSGKRKRAIAHATISEGKGNVRVNNKYLDFHEPKIYRLRMMEPLLIAGDMTKNIDVNIRVLGGGVSSQADAVRLAIGRGLVKHTPDLRQTFLEYDRTILVADVRRKESAKPNSHGQARAKRQKSYR